MNIKDFVMNKVVKPVTFIAYGITQVVGCSESIPQYNGIDLNNDGIEDKIEWAAIDYGYSGKGQPRLMISLSNQDGTYQKPKEIMFPNSFISNALKNSVKFRDIDNDKDKDIVYSREIQGTPGPSVVLDIYRENDGQGNFSREKIVSK